MNKGTNERSKDYVALSCWLLGKKLLLGNIYSNFIYKTLQQLIHWFKRSSNFGYSFPSIGRIWCWSIRKTGIWDDVH